MVRNPICFFTENKSRPFWFYFLYTLLQNHVWLIEPGRPCKEGVLQNSRYWLPCRHPCSRFNPPTWTPPYHYTSASVNWASNQAIRPGHQDRQARPSSPGHCTWTLGAPRSWCQQTLLTALLTCLIHHSQDNFIISGFSTKLISYMYNQMLSFV